MRLEKHTPPPEENGGVIGDLEEVLDDKSGKRRIRCPCCAWQPGKEDLWGCSPPCLHAWNTFDTAGVCPKCQRQWAFTQCLRCHQFSAHEDWYEKGSGSRGA